MRLLPLVAATYFMVSGGPYGIEDILGGAGYAKALIILVTLPFLWSLPTALMIGELASAIPAEGGFYVWVRRALGPFWGYQEAWLSLTASIFDMAIYPTLFVLYLGRLFPGWTAGSRGTLWELAVIVGCCLWNLRGAPAVGNGSLGLFFLLLTPFAVLVGAAFLHGRHVPVQGMWSMHGSEETGLATAILVGLWNYMGWDNASTVAQEVEDPQRNYPRAMVMSTIVVAVTYVVPLFAMAWVAFPIDQFTTGSWTDAARSLAGPWLGTAIVIGGTLTAFGMFNALMMSYARLPMTLAEDGMLPSVLALRNRRGVPWVAVLACGIAWALALQFSFERLISMDLMLYGASLILEFVALIVLRIREPRLERPFRAGNLATACLIGAVPTGLILYAVWCSRNERMAHMPALLFGAIIACSGPIFYRFSKTIWARPEPLPNPGD
ncbi:APC family permease [Paracidobacterium acidisoli]|uniref:APC family permease n=1 Tax=Paracidobacterium acidisoli TaxID=2303751 RepID=A0A372ILM0_9BACT|nr:APC family permease [Paracidobacterium acidisoli]MBT9332452.1 APC family permease [Paracidobacterium acidisoli]